ncbi:MAG: sulfatase maturase [Bacteroidetes bacterium CG2_30_33_31]|nr:MAG: sulfatase maturase [Bacteroidetes bacterium CG2_30_33_31]
MNLVSLYNELRAYTTKICAPLKTEDFIPQPAIFASPIKWHLAHTTWFFETFILMKFLPNYKIFNSKFSFLFNSYYNNAGERLKRVNRGLLTRPLVSEVFEYRMYVDIAINQLLNDASLMNKNISDLIILGINHEQQHQELMWTDLKYLFSCSPLLPVYEADLPFTKSIYQTKQEFIKIETDTYNIGNIGNDFCYDNEKAFHKVYLNEFEISNMLVTKSEFAEFVNDGGYNNFNLWHDDAWHWLNNEKIKSPIYWHEIDNKWYEYTLKGLLPIAQNEAMNHISYYEAFAYAEWKGMRLPTEFEWEVASDKFEWGDVWEWTSSAYLPYPNFIKAEGAIGEYNGKFMVNQHVCRGASVATSRNHSRNTYRNFFSPEMRWQFTGLRIIKK